MHKFAPTSEQTEKVILLLTKAIVTGNVPFSFIENCSFRAALAVLGVELPSRRVLAERLIPELAATVEVASAQKLAHLPLFDA